MKFKSNIFCAVIAATISLSASVNAQTLGLKTVVIDPGHGGKDAGAVSADKKTMEKSIVLDISEKLRDKISSAYPGVKVLMTRDDDSFVELNNRARFATNNNADLFISVHINSVDGKRTAPNGYSVHILGPSNDKNKDTYAFNMEVCKKENEVILLEEDYSTTYQGFDPNNPESDIYLRLMANSYREQSLIFAQLVDDKMKKGPFTKDNGIYQNNFAVLRLASMPAVLLELGFISNPNDLTQLRKESARNNIAQNLFEAFCEYKSFYDESVGAVKEKAQRTENNDNVQSATSEVQETRSAFSVDESCIYATQVLASSKDMKPDDPYFLGYTCKKMKSGKLYKYYIGISTDLEEAKKISRDIRKKYPDAFLVKIENDMALRVNQ